MNCLVINYWVWCYTQKKKKKKPKAHWKEKKKLKCSFPNRLNLISAAHMFMGVTSPTKALTIYQEPRPWRKLSLHPLAAINYKEHFSQGGASWIPLSFLLGFWLAPPCTSLLQAATAADSSRPLLRPEDTVLWQLSLFFGSCNLSAPSFVIFLNIWGKKVNTDVPFRAQYCTVIYFLHSDQLWLSSPSLTS